MVESSFAKINNLGTFLKDRQRKLLELLDKSGASLYALLTRLTLREDIAEEMMQELFIKLSNFRYLDNIDNLPCSYSLQYHLGFLLALYSNLILKYDFHFHYQYYSME